MDPAVMLTLASIIYRGCELDLSDPAARERGRNAMVECLNTFDKVKGQWELVWGPAGFAPAIAGLDISAMYVARQVADPSQFAVVVRGTNLYSLTDWASNLLIERRPWPYAASTTPAAIISHSTALGLGFLQRLLSASPSTTAQTAGLWATAGEWVESHKARLEFNLLNRLAGLNIPPTLDVFGPIENRINNLASSALSQSELAIVRQFASKIADGRAQPIDDAALLEQVDREQQNIASGISLVDFLRGCIEPGGPHLDIYVTGHSKGGPLAVALATWLADTQSGGDPAEQWDTSHRATIHSFTFAAPTPGNQAFADHFQSRIRDRYRLFNPNDLVPHVWKVEEARAIPALYSGQLGFLDGVVAAVLPILEAAKYQHEITDPTPWTPLPAHQADLIEQIKFNHLDAYLTQLGILSGDLCFAKLFAPLT
jgi:hypothetical protein